MTDSRACWCGNTDLQPFSPEYAACPRCGTLVTRTATAVDALDVRDDAHDFYGREYWLTHQRQDLRTPDIATRARADLPERCLHWLRALLAYRRPPARVLELGAAHGGYVALLRWAGFDAAGLELSPWVVDYARRAFDVPMLLGRIESQALAPGSFDILIMNDVVEHLPDPVGTLRRCVDLLAPGGVLMVQMPNYDEGRGYEELEATEDRFLQHIQGMAVEHQHLFSQRAARQLFAEVGLPAVAFEPPMFPYDMFVVASRAPVRTAPFAEAIAALLERPGGRLVTALLDLDVERSRLDVELQRANVDRARRLEDVETLSGLLNEANDDREQRLRQVNELTSLLAEANDDREQRLSQTTELTRLLQEANADREARLEQIHMLTRLLRQIRPSLDLRADAGIDLPRDIDPGPPARPDPVTRLLRRVGLVRASEVGARVTRKSRIAIDLTPILPGSENGGAKQLVIELLNGFAAEGRHEYVLLTTETNHDSFASYEQRGMRRLCLGAAGRASFAQRVVRRVTRKLSAAAGLRGRLAGEGIDLLFCPMTDPVHAEPGIPTVSIVYDLQHVSYPAFFSAAEREHRQRFFDRVRRTADAAVCISEFTRSILVAEAGVAATRAVAIPIAVHHRLHKAPPEAVEELRARHQLGAAPYAFYPANFWPHKNHRLLLVAMAAYLHEHPESDLQLVLSGNTLDQQEEMTRTIADMQLTSRVHLLGYVSDEDLAALWTGAWCLLYPSLYEGFGIPLLEAWRFGIPVICSDVASLPEVGGDAALFVDPRKPETIVDALHRLATTPDLRAALIERGAARLDTFRPPEMVTRYLDLFDRAIVEGGQVQIARVEGVFGDGWLAPEATATTGGSEGTRRWEFDLQAPDWHPHPRTTIRVEVDGRAAQRLALERGQSQTLVIPVPRGGARVRLSVSPSFVPQGSADTRQLTVMVTRGQLLDAESGTIAYEL